LKATKKNSVSLIRAFFQDDLFKSRFGTRYFLCLTSKVSKYASKAFKFYDICLLACFFCKCTEFNSSTDNGRAFDSRNASRR